MARSDYPKEPDVSARLLSMCAFTADLISQTWILQTWAAKKKKKELGSQDLCVLQWTRQNQCFTIKKVPFIKTTSAILKRIHSSGWKGSDPQGVRSEGATLKKKKIHFSVKTPQTLSGGFGVCCWDPQTANSAAVFLSCPAETFFPVTARSFRGLKVRKAAGVFFIVTGNDEHGLVELVVAKLLKGDGGCDRGENGDVCGKNRKLVFTFTPA